MQAKYTICYNITKANEQVLNRYIKDIITERERVDQANQGQKEALRKEKKEPVIGLPLCLDKETGLDEIPDSQRI